MPRFVAIRSFPLGLKSGARYQYLEADNIEHARAKVLAEELDKEFRDSIYGMLREIRVFRVDEELMIDIGKIADEWEAVEEAKRDEKKERARRLLKDAGLEGVLG